MRATPLVLMYHSVTPYVEDPYLITVSPARFERQLDWLRRSGQRGVSMRELLDARRDGRARGLVGLTFDDGYADFREYALPALRHYGFTATLFVIAGKIGGENDWDERGPRKRLLTETELGRVAELGVEIGSHSHTHASLPKVGDANRLTEEIEHSRKLLRELTGQPIRGFCYPYGDVDATAVDRVAAAGYDYGCAIWRSELTGRHALPRTYVGDTDTGPRLIAKRMRHVAQDLAARR